MLIDKLLLCDVTAQLTFVDVAEAILIQVPWVSLTQVPLVVLLHLHVPVLPIVVLVYHFGADRAVSVRLALNCISR